LVEQLAFNQWVAGSSPARLKNLFRTAHLDLPHLDQSLESSMKTATTKQGVWNQFKGLFKYVLFDMPGLLRYALIFLVLSSFTFALLSYFLAPEKETAKDFLSSFSLNIVAELIGIVVGILIPLIVALWYAGKKFEEAATPLAEFVAQLRADKKISKEAARRSMVCAVTLISQDHISLLSNNSFTLGYEEKDCDVCDLPIRIGEDDKSCDFCGIKQHIWEIKNKPVISPPN
jgi:hypothetical protein